MDWKTCAVDDLRRYNHMKIGILNSKDKLRAISHAVEEGRKLSGKRSKRMDTRLVDAIVEAERLKDNIATAESLTALVERGLSSLREEERRILEAFYMSERPKTVRQVKEELGYATRSIYRLRDNALKKFTLAMYGVEVS